MGVVRGAIVVESLRPGTVLEGDGMLITRWSRYEVSDRPDYQPSVWTLIEFEAPAASSTALAEKLAASLLEPGWYANWSSDDQATVVFPSKVFRYHHGDVAAMEAAKRHARRCGVPESQIDWTG